MRAPPWLSASSLALAAACTSATPGGSSAGTSLAASTTAAASGAASSGSGAGTSSGGGSSSGAGTSTGGGTGPTTLPCPAGGLPGLTLTANQNEELAGNCVIHGDLTLGGSASLAVGANVLTVIGNIALSGTAALTIDGGILGIGNLTSFEYGIFASDSSTFVLANGRLVTNPGGVDNFTSTVAASGTAKLVFDNATIDSNHNWLLADLQGSSTLNGTDSSTPNELYLGDTCTVSLSGAGTNNTLWLRLTDGTSGTLPLPNWLLLDSWAAGSATGLNVGWNVTTSDGAHPGVGIESHAGSSWTIVGADAGVKEATIGLYLDPATAPDAGASLSGLPIGVIGAASPMTLSFAWSSKPQLTLENVNLGPIAWQVYVGSIDGTGAVPVDLNISDSVVNEIGVTAGSVEVDDSTLQLAVLAALTPGASIHASGDDIWCQTILAIGGGSIAIDGSSIHGALMQATNGGQITVGDSSVLWANGDQPTCDVVATIAHMAADNGRPICSPFTAAMQLSAMIADSASSIDVAGPANPACLALDAGSYTPAILIEQQGNPVLGAAELGSVSCAQDGTSAVVASPFAAYPAGLWRDATSDDVLVPDAGYACTVSVGSASNGFQITAPSCALE